jgi:hypothetical protein
VRYARFKFWETLPMFRSFAALLAAVCVAGCSSNATKDLELPVEAMGHFRLGHAEVVAPSLQKLLVSRDATEEEWVETVDLAFEKRFRRFEGDQFYHIGVSVEAYSLPPPVMLGKSALAAHVTLWRDSTQSKMNEEPKLFHVIQVFETRLGLSREEQMQHLAERLANDVEVWLREQMETQDWFAIELEEGAEDVIQTPAGDGQVADSSASDAAQGVTADEAPEGTEEAAAQG